MCSSCSQIYYLCIINMSLGLLTNIPFRKFMLLLVFRLPALSIILFERCIVEIFVFLIFMYLANFVIPKRIRGWWDKRFKCRLVVVAVVCVPWYSTDWLIDSGYFGNKYINHFLSSLKIRHFNFLLSSNKLQLKLGMKSHRST